MNQSSDNFHHNYRDFGKEERERQIREGIERRKRNLKKWSNANAGAIDYHNFM